MSSHSAPSSSAPQPYHPRRRRWLNFVYATALALVLYVVLPSWIAEVPRLVACYDFAACWLLAMLWFFGLKSDAKATQSRAAAQDPGRNVDLSIVLACVTAGLVAAIAILGREPHVTRLSEKLLIYALGIGAVVIGWLLVHTLFTFRYAHLFYYDDDQDQNADRGLAFPGTKEPNDADFAYFSFVIGMTFQVSDVQITDQGVRRVVLTHALISFAYNTAIVALGINLLSGLFH